MAVTVWELFEVWEALVVEIAALLCLVCAMKGIPIVPVAQ